MAEVDLKRAVGKILNIKSIHVLAEAEFLTEKIGADTVKSRTEGLEGWRPWEPQVPIH